MKRQRASLPKHGNERVCAKCRAYYRRRWSRIGDLYLAPDKRDS